MNTKRINLTGLAKLRISQAELAAARELAARSGLTLSELIRLLLRLAVSGEIEVRK